MVPTKYRQVINPNQTRSEITAQVKFLDRMINKLGWDDLALIELLLLDKPAVRW